MSCSLLWLNCFEFLCFFFFQAKDGIRDTSVTGVQTCALPICHLWRIDSGRCFAHPENFKITGKHVPPELLKIYLKKGVYPYEFMNSWEKFFKIQLPPKEAL